MRYINYLSLILVLVIIQACRKNPTEDDRPLDVSLNIVNAVASDDADIKVSTSDRKFAFQHIATHSYYNNGGAGYYGLPGEKDVKFTIAMASDTMNHIYSETKRFEHYGFYTLYLSGPPNGVDALLIKENILAHTDSTTGVRFINLCKDCDAVNVAIAADSPVPFASNLRYQDITPFKSLAATAAISAYGFQVLDSATGDEMAFFYYDNIARMRNVTLVLRGRRDGSVYLEVARINN